MLRRSRGPRSARCTAPGMQKPRETRISLSSETPEDKETRLPLCSRISERREMRVSWGSAPAEGGPACLRARPAPSRLPSPPLRGARLESAKPYPSGVVGLHYVRAR
jgi:hypothetical protein